MQRESRSRWPGRRALALSACLALGGAVVTFSATARWSRAGTLVKSDGLAYFLYARSVVLDFDTDVTAEYEELDRRTPIDDNNWMVALRLHAERSSQTGKIVLPWPVGAGLVMVPFYAFGYGVETVVANVLRRPVDSYGSIPQFFYSLGSLVYGWLGFWATWLCCRRVAGERDSYAAALAMILAGPTVFYVFVSPSMAHAATFGCTALFVLLWWRQWDGEVERDGALGLLFGIAMTLRYQSVMFLPLLVALVWRTLARDGSVAAIRRALVLVFFCAVPLAVQGLHYLSVSSTGGFTWQGRGFQAGQHGVDLTSPHFFEVLFSCHHGAFYWTPILGLGCAGLLWAARREGWAQLLFVTFVSHVYLIGATTTYRAAGQSFGLRYMVELTPLLAPGLAIALDRSLRGTRRGGWLWLTLLGVLILFNGLLILAFGMGSIPGSDCVTYREMVAGIGDVVSRVARLISR